MFVLWYHVVHTDVHGAGGARGERFEAGDVTNVADYCILSLCGAGAQASATTLPSWLGFPSDGLFRRVLSAIGLTFCLFFGPVVADTLLYIVSRNEEEKSVVLLSRFQLIHHWTVAFRNLVVVSRRDVSVGSRWGDLCVDATLSLVDCRRQLRRRSCFEAAYYHYCSGKVTR